MFNNSVCAKCHLLSVRIFFFVTFNLGRRLGIRIRTVAVCVSLPPNKKTWFPSNSGLKDLPS